MSRPPQVIAGYQIQRKLSSGGMGTVYLASRKSSHGFEKNVAIKVLNPEFFDREDVKQLFVDEARLAAQLNHPNICQVFDFGVEEGLFYLVMEYVEGLRLLDIQRAQAERLKPLPQALAARIVADAARGLHYAHELRSPEGAALGVVHRDVSPENIIVTPTGHTKVLDFGIARWADRIAVTRQHVVRGKAAYMSPEQVRGVRLDRRSDVFALGIVLWELLTCRHLFFRGLLVETMQAVEHEPVMDPRDVNRAVHPALVKLLNRALERDVDLRLQSAEQMALELEEAIRVIDAPAATENLAEHIHSQVLPRLQEQAEVQPTEPGAATQTSPGPEQAGQAARVTAALDQAFADAQLGTGRAEGVSTRAMPVAGGEAPEPTGEAGDSLAASGAMSVGQSAATDLLPPPSRRGPALLLGGGLAAGVAVVLVLLNFNNVDSSPGDGVLDPGAATDASAAPDRDPKFALELTRTRDAAPPEAPARHADAGRLADAGTRPGPKHRPPRARKRDAGVSGGARKRGARPDSGQAPDVAATGFGSVSVFAEVYGNVRIDGVLLGPTPVVTHRLSAGTHLVEILEPATSQVRERRQIQVSVGGHVKVETRGE